MQCWEKEKDLNLSYKIAIQSTEWNGNFQLMIRVWSELAPYVKICFFFFFVCELVCHSLHHFYSLASGQLEPQLFHFCLVNIFNWYNFITTSAVFHWEN